MDQQSIITQVSREDCEQIKCTNTTEKGKPLCASVPPLRISTEVGPRNSRAALMQYLVFPISQIELFKAVYNLHGLGIYCVCSRCESEAEKLAAAGESFLLFSSDKRDCCTADPTTATATSVVIAHLTDDSNNQYYCNHLHRRSCISRGCCLCFL